MSAVDVALPRIQQEEGFRGMAYLDTEGHRTIGYGFDVDAGITQYAATGLLTAQLQELDRAFQVFQWYAALDPVRQSVCIDMAFNLGFHEFVNGWPRLIAALTARNWAAAQAECHTSTVEDEGRYTALGQLLLTGGAS